MKKIMLKHPIDETDMEVFIGKVEEDNRLIISIPSESTCIEMINESISWGYLSIFANVQGRENFEKQLKKHL